jgi:hypothetical protein
MYHCPIHKTMLSFCIRRTLLLLLIIVCASTLLHSQDSCPTDSEPCSWQKTTIGPLLFFPDPKESGNYAAGCYARIEVCYRCCSDVKPSKMEIRLTRITWNDPACPSKWNFSQFFWQQVDNALVMYGFTGRNSAYPACGYTKCTDLPDCASVAKGYDPSKVYVVEISRVACFKYVTGSSINPSAGLEPCNSSTYCTKQWTLCCPGEMKDPQPMFVKYLEGQTIECPIQSGAQQNSEQCFGSCW